jgi:wyosine [tRNA(Phe)-imidazoG37] synthetase (radical SAM superfamily)
MSYPRRRVSSLKKFRLLKTYILLSEPDKQKKEKFMPEQLIKSIPLDNGQVLNIYDASKNIAGDRWQVNLVARIVISVNEISLENNAANATLSEIEQALGDTVEYEIKKQRNFIDDKEKQTVLTDLLDTFIKYSAPYLSHPDFPKRFIIKKYHERKNSIRR